VTDLCLVQTPFSAVYHPSIALGILKTGAEKTGLSCTVDYANLRFARMTGIKSYEAILSAGIQLLAGEVLFSECAGFTRRQSDEEYFKFVEQVYKAHDGNYLNTVSALKEVFYSVKAYTGRFIQETAEYLLSFSPKIIACSSTFQQNNASFALFNKIKALDPRVITLLGGVQCTTEAGAAISKYIKSVDYVFSGEADTVFGELCEKLVRGGRREGLENLPYGTIKGGAYRGDAPPYALTRDLAEVPVPDYSDYFNDLRKYDPEKAINPAILVEGSRGCWWGEKKPCTFCGLGGHTRKYRAKKTESLLDEMADQYQKFRISRFSFTDSILSNEHIAELLPALLRTKPGYTLFCEIKSNLTVPEVKNLRDAGFTFIQPGIENLQDDMLRLMNKGNTAIKHVELLKYCRSYGLKVAWNILVGLPGEKEEWIEELAALIPLISHLQVCNNVNHIIFQKNSVYTDHQDKYGISLEPIQAYRYAYPGSEPLSSAVAYNFEPATRDEKDKYYSIFSLNTVYRRLYQAFRLWARNFIIKADRMQMSEYDDRIEILDLRHIAVKNYYTLRGLEMEIYRDCGTVRKTERLFERYRGRYDGQEIQNSFDFLKRHYLILVIGGDVLSLAAEDFGYTYEKNESPYGYVAA
jgi:magnesium-protoporphyrin IX monomethyl ester (oxidative) cyclase